LIFMANFPHRPKKLEVRDEFKKDYTIRTTDDCFCVERKSMCLWEGEGATLKWNPAYNKLEVNDGTLTTLKQSFQGEIVGNSLAWGGGVSVEEGCNCDPTCCMYPADGLGDIYEVEDLLDSILLNVTPGVDFTFSSLLLNKVTPITEGDYTYYFTGEGDGEEAGVGIDTTVPEWVVASKGPSGFSPVTSLGNCLITGDGNLTPGDDTVEDQFADCYEVSNPGNGNDVAAGTVQVFRVSLCRWESANFNDGPISNALRASLEYLSGGEFEGDPRGDLWSAGSGTLQAESPAGGVKESLSSPLGTYEGDFLPNVTVSPCF
jgi:hypothetical protein